MSEDHKFQCVVSADLVRRVQIAVSTEETRFYLNGFHVEPCAEGGAILVATDGTKMLVFRDPDGVVFGSGIVKLSPTALKALKPGKGEALDRLLVVSGDRAAIIFGNDVERAELISLAHSPDASVAAYQPAGSLIDGSFPEWRRVLPHGESQPVTATFNAAFVQDLAQALAPASYRKSYVTLVGKGSDMADAAKGPHMMFAPAPLQGFGVIMPERDERPSQGAAPSWTSSPVAQAA